MLFTVHFLAHLAIVTEVLHDVCFTLQILKIEVVICITNRVWIFLEGIILVARDEHLGLSLVAVSAIFVAHLQSLLESALPAA